MQVAEGILTARGGLGQPRRGRRPGLGHPGRGGRRGREDRRYALHRRRASSVDEGDVISLDGTTGEVVLGAMALADAEPPAEFAHDPRWADRVRKGKLAVRANADTGPDATVARDFGAEGIGLCRTEHMFLAEDRLPIVRAMILAHTPEEEAAALEQLRVGAEGRLPRDPRGDGRPARHGPPARPAAARVPAVGGGAAGAAGHHRPRPPRRPPCSRPPSRGASRTRCSARAASASACSSRGSTPCRCGRSWRRRSICHAAGKHPIVEIMIPLTVSREELLLARGWVEEADRRRRRARTPRASRSRSAR